MANGGWKQQHLKGRTSVACAGEESNTVDQNSIVNESTEKARGACGGLAEGHVRRLIFVFVLLGLSIHVDDFSVGGNSNLDCARDSCCSLFADWKNIP